MENSVYRGFDHFNLKGIYRCHFFRNSPNSHHPINNQHIRMVEELKIGGQMKQVVSKTYKFLRGNSRTILEDSKV